MVTLTSKFLCSRLECKQQDSIEHEAPNLQFMSAGRSPNSTSIAQSENIVIVLFK